MLGLWKTQSKGGNRKIMVPLINYKKEKLLQENTIEALMLRIALNISTAEFSSKSFSDENSLACSGYLGETVDQSIIYRIFKRPSIKGIDIAIIFIGL